MRADEMVGSIKCSRRRFKFSCSFIRTGRHNPGEGTSSPSFALMLKDHVDLDILDADRYKGIFSSRIEWIPKHEG